MGREATCPCQAGAHRETVRAMLEADEIRVRGATLKLRAAPTSLQRLAVAGDDLVFEAEGQPWRLSLGAVEAGKWLIKLTTPPPTLATKLGVSADKPAFIVGTVDDADLAAALHGATTADPARASVLLAVIASLDDLGEALRVHGGMACPGIWMVYRKGRAAEPGDPAIRERLRSLGYADHKTCGVSAVWTATRYARKSPDA